MKTLLAQLRLVFEAPLEMAAPPAASTGPAALAMPDPVGLLAPRLVRHARARQYVLRLLLLFLAGRLAVPRARQLAWAEALHAAAVAERLPELL